MSIWESRVEVPFKIIGFSLLSMTLSEHRGCIKELACLWVRIVTSKDFPVARKKEKIDRAGIVGWSVVRIKVPEKKKTKTFLW